MSPPAIAATALGAELAVAGFAIALGRAAARGDRQLEDAAREARAQRERCSAQGRSRAARARRRSRLHQAPRQ